MLEILVDGEKCVCDLVDEVGASQPLVSHHLAILKKAGLVNDRHYSTWAYYSVNRKNWADFQDAVAGIQPAATPSPPCPPEGSSK